MKWIIDRIEEDMAVVELRGKLLDIPLFALPEGAREGSVIELLLSEDKKRGERIEEKMNRLFKD